MTQSHSNDRPRILVVYPGPTTSTFDVANGYYDALSHMEEFVTRKFSYHNWLVYHDISMQHFIEETEADGVKKSYNTNDVIKLANDNLIAEVVKLKPDLVFIVGGTAIAPQTFGWLCNLQNDLKTGFTTAIYLTECPYMQREQIERASYIDVVFVNDKYSVDVIDGSIYLPHAYNQYTHMYNPTVEPNYECDVFFVGSLFPERIEFFEEYLGYLDGNYIVRICGNISKKFDDEKKAVAFGKSFPRFDKVYEETSLKNKDVVGFYRNSSISINLHRLSKTGLVGPNMLVNGRVSDEDVYSTNMRTYEIPASGGFMISDYRKELSDLLRNPGQIVFSSAYDAAVLTKAYIGSPNERERVRREVYEDIVLLGANSYLDRVRFILSESLKLSLG